MILDSASSLNNPDIARSSKLAKNYCESDAETLKESLKNKTLNAEFRNHEFFFTIERDDAYSAAMCDFSLFFTRAEIQNETYKKCSTKMSASWRFVTLYYMAFFAATAIAKIHNKGYLYIDEKLSNSLSSILTSYASNVYTVIPKGNYSYWLKKYNGIYSIVLKKDSRGAHEATWQNIENAFKQVRMVTTPPDTNFLDEVLLFLNNNESSPYALRNIINYTGSIGIEEIKNKFSFSYDATIPDDDLIDEFTKELVSQKYQSNKTFALLFDFIYRYAECVCKKIGRIESNYCDFFNYIQLYKTQIL